MQTAPQPPATPSERVLMDTFRAQQVLTQHRFERAQHPRNEPQPIHRPVLLRHQLPLSSSSTLSAQPVSTLSGTATPMVSSPMDRLMETQRLLAQVRQQRQDQHTLAALQAAATATGIWPPASMAGSSTDPLPIRTRPMAERKHTSTFSHNVY